MPKPTTRVQLELPNKSFERLTTLKVVTEASSYAEVMKNALRLYEFMIAQHGAGRRLYLKSEDGALVEYALFT